MRVEEVLHMVGGAGETSYASNSKFQEKALLMTKPVLDDAIGGVYKSLLPVKMVVADLETLNCVVIVDTLIEFLELNTETAVLGIVGDLCRRLEQKPPEIRFFLNDLRGNDLNNVFRSLERYEKKIEEKGVLLVPHYVVACPVPSTGGFSLVPQGLESKQGVPLNKGNIYIAENSPPQVVKAYQEQHRRDLHVSQIPLRRTKHRRGNGNHIRRQSGHLQFANLWSFDAGSEVSDRGEGSFDVEEAESFESSWDPFDDSDNVPQGLESKQGVPLNKGNIYIAENSPPQVVKAYQEQHRRDLHVSQIPLRRTKHRRGNGRKTKHPATDELSYLCGFLAEALNAMVSQGIISEDKVDTFNLPIYGASMQEVKSVIEEEGSFDVEEAESFESSWDPFDDSDNVLNGKNVASTLQAVMEPLISHHFGDAIPHALFSLNENKLA
ncbi:hypothetical protein C4D60_Mb07t06940 [Musa balbisiana]|uniref:Uncharacterized protein n=1 Tax=Musa balbisiana TaxID=52838 RepID=A0A4S8JDH5_MUSBA|nr:hypothetical protein C4D60_Mb07t06940 [Musa balbisiana]